MYVGGDKAQWTEVDRGGQRWGLPVGIGEGKKLLSNTHQGILQLDCLGKVLY